MAAVNLRHIEIFHAVMTAGNLTEAARLLHTSQPTVSRELARFEKVLGLTLFERTRGRLHPTVQGLRLLKRYSVPGTGWIESSAPRKACGSFVRGVVYCLSAGFFAVAAACIDSAVSCPLSGSQPEYRAAGVTAAGRVAFRSASRSGADGDVAYASRN